MAEFAIFMRNRPAGGKTCTFFFPSLAKVEPGAALLAAGACVMSGALMRRRLPRP